MMIDDVVETKVSEGRVPEFHAAHCPDPFFDYQQSCYFSHPDVSSILEKDLRHLFASYFSKYSLVRHQIESYNHLLERTIPEIIRENNKIEVISKSSSTKHVIEFSDVAVCKPMFKENDGTVNYIKPNEAMIRKATYANNILVNLTHKVFERIPKQTGEAKVSNQQKTEGQIALVSDNTSQSPKSVALQQNELQKNELQQHEAEGMDVENFTEDDPYLSDDEKKITSAKTPVPTPNPSTLLRSYPEEEKIEQEVEYDEILRESRVYEQVSLCRMPTMVGSAFCHAKEQVYDVSCPFVSGGYFIVNGNEKVILPQEKLRSNYPYVTTDKGKLLFKAEVRSWHESKMRSTSTLYIHLSCTRGGTLPTIFVEVPFIKGSISLNHVFRMIGVNTQSEMRSYILAHDEFSGSEHPYDHYIRSILKDDKSELNLEDLKDYIGKKGIKEPTKEKRIRYIENIFSNEFLPHMGLDKTPEVERSKAYYLGYVIMKLLRVYHGDEEPDDRDHYANKRVDTCDVLCGLLFRQLLRVFLKNFMTSIHKAIESDKYVFVIDMMKNSKRITAGFKYALSTGKWGMSKGASTQTGVAQVLTRMTPLSTIGHLRRINTPINREGKLAQPRQLHPSSWGLIGCSETPEGSACGLVKNMAILCHIRIGYSIKTVVDLIMPHIVPFLSVPPDQVPQYSDCSRRGFSDWVFVNGKIIGLIGRDRSSDFVKWLRNLKRCQDIPFDTSITHKQSLKEIHITLDSGCLMRPVIVLENVYKFADIYNTYKHDSYILWDKMLSNGVIEYLDKEEESTMRIAVMWDDLKIPRVQGEAIYTHIEIHPIVILGLCAAIIPFSDFNQAPRVTYGSVMLKQGLGLVGINYNMRFDTAPFHTLFYPQRPSVSTFVERLTHLDRLPWSQTAIVAIACYTGYNQEDSIILNKGSLDRGMFRSFHFKTHKETAKNVGADQESFEIPDEKEVSGMKIGNYTKIQEDATMNIGEDVRQDDVIIGKVMKTEALGARNGDEIEFSEMDLAKLSRRDKGDVLKKDRSIMYRSREPARIDRITTTLNKDGASSINVRTRGVRIPVIGDKLSSSSGQKGVISLILPQEDMPFTKDSIVPDLIINPHCIPSRMTIGQLLEMLLGKTAALEGHIGDGTPFQPRTSKDDEEENDTTLLANKIGDVLHSVGYERTGHERMYNGQTGEMMEALIFIGPCRYMRLKHMVSDKVHARCTGPRQILTHQPVEGRSREGGLRFGEMERDMIISHGAAAVLQDRLLNNSDYYETVVCEQCGQFAEPAPPRPRHHRRLLGDEAKAYCRRCKSGDHVRRVVMPYAFKVLIQDMEAFHMRMKMELVSQ